MGLHFSRNLDGSGNKYPRFKKKYKHVVPDGFIALTKKSSEELHHQKDRAVRRVSLTPCVESIPEEGSNLAEEEEGPEAESSTSCENSWGTRETDIIRDALIPSKGTTDDVHVEKEIASHVITTDSEYAAIISTVPKKNITIRETPMSRSVGRNIKNAYIF